MKNETPLVTILTLVYNGLPHLKESIDSSLNQTFKDFILLIMDDASPDPKVSELIESYDDPRIKIVINKNNLGVADTFNKALSLIDTPYVVRTDQDDVSTPDRVKDQVEFLQNNKDVSIICSWEHTIDSKGNRGRDWKRECKNYGEFIGPILLCICPIWHPSIAFRKDDMIEAGGFRKEYTRAEDFEVTARMAFKRYEASIIPRFHLLQRQHESSQSREFEHEQAKIANKVQEEIISGFIETSDLSGLAAFLRLEVNIFKLEVDKLKYLSKQVRDLLIAVKKINKLNASEYKSLKITFYKRMGVGFYFEQFFNFFPKRLYKILFILLSPQMEINTRLALKKIYNRIA